MKFPVPAACWFSVPVGWVGCSTVIRYCVTAARIGRMKKPLYMVFRSTWVKSRLKLHPGTLEVAVTYSGIFSI